MTTRAKAATIAALTALLWGMIYVCVGKALAHSFYDYSCCSDRDCKPVPTEAIRVTPKGYVYVPSGEVIGYSDRRIRATPPEDTQQRYHVCTTGGMPLGKVLCLYVPQGGV